MIELQDRRAVLWKRRQQLVEERTGGQLAGAIIIAGAALGLVSSVPKREKWYGNVADALPNNLILPTRAGTGDSGSHGHCSMEHGGRTGRYAAGFPLCSSGCLGLAIGNHTTLNHYG